MILRLLYTVGDLVSIAIERARLYASRACEPAPPKSAAAWRVRSTIRWRRDWRPSALQLECADCLLDETSNAGQAQDVVRQALALTRANLEEARRSVRDLRAAPLEGRYASGRTARAGCRSGPRQGNPKVRFEVVGESRPFSVRIENGLYRMAQEALANIAQSRQCQPCPDASRDHASPDPTGRPRQRAGLRRDRGWRRALWTGRTQRAGPAARRHAAGREQQRRRHAHQPDHSTGWSSMRQNMSANTAHCRSKAQRRSPIRIVVADDHPIVREGLAADSRHSAGLSSHRAGRQRRRCRDTGNRTGARCPAAGPGNAGYGRSRGPAPTA